MGSRTRQVLFKKRDFYQTLGTRRQVGPWTGKATWVVNFGCGAVHFPWFYRGNFKIFRFLFFNNILVPIPRCCPSSERCESRRAAPDRNANSGELRFVLWWLEKADKTFCSRSGCFTVALLSGIFVSSHLAVQRGIKAVGGCRAGGCSAHLAKEQVE